MNKTSGLRTRNKCYIINHWIQVRGDFHAESCTFEVMCIHISTRRANNLYCIYSRIFTSSHRLFQYYIHQYSSAIFFQLLYRILQPSRQQLGNSPCNVFNFFFIPPRYKYIIIIFSCAIISHPAHSITNHKSSLVV